MIVVGIDPHKRSHTAVAVDAVSGERRSQLTVPATAQGAARLLAWAGALDPSVRWAVEDCRHVSGRLERCLLARGQRLVRVSPRLMALARRGGRARGKSDPIDALAVARAALREPGLPQATTDTQTGELKLLLDHRDDLVGERTRMQQRLRWHLLELDLDTDIPAGALDRPIWQKRVSARLAAFEQTLQVQIAREQLERISQLSRQARELEQEIAGRVREQAQPLLALPGCGPLTAAKILVEVAGINRFRSDAQLAMHAGVAPLDASSGRQQRHRLNRTGNRQLNCAVHRIAIVQGSWHPPAIDYLQRRQQQGKTRREAIRCLKRQLIRSIDHILRQIETSPNLT